MTGYLAAPGGDVVAPHALSAGPIVVAAQYSLRRDDSDFVVFCFAKPIGARPLPSASAGSGCLRIGDNPESKRGGLSALFRMNTRSRTSAHVGGPDR
jgi:hypothetical protein